MRKARFCFVIASLKAGGQERVMTELSNWFVKEDFEVTLILLNKCKVFYTLDHRVKLIEPHFSLNGFNQIFYFIRILFFTRRTIRQNSPDAVLSFGRKHNPYVILSLTGLKIPIFVSDRGSPNYYGGFFNELLRKLTYKRVNGIIAQTSLAKSTLIKTFGDVNIEIIPNPLRKIEIYNSKRGKIILYVGRLVPFKGVDLLINSFSKACQDGWKLIIIGDGPERFILEQLVKRLELIDRVIFTGEIKNVDKYLSEGEIFAFPSLSEGFPNALLEAMANGLACVSFDCIAGPSDIIEDGKSGFLSVPGDITDFADKLVLLMKDEDLRKRIQRTALSVIDKYNINSIANKYLNFIIESKDDWLC